MDLVVNHSELNDFCDNVLLQSNLFDEQIELWLSKLEELQEVWKGEDASIFFENATSYIKRMKVISNCFESLDDFTLNANKEYRNSDLEWKREIEKQSQTLNMDKGDKYV